MTTPRWAPRAHALNTFEAPLHALVQGASRGLGLEFVRHLLACDNIGHVFATCRSPARANALRALGGAHRLTIIPLDVQDEASIAAAAHVVQQQTETLQLLINSAGLLHDGDQMWPEKRLADVEPGNLIRSFEVNALGPLLMGKHFHAFFHHRQRAAWINMSARLGSIGDNHLGGWYAYRTTKAALNMVTRTFAIELRRRAKKTIAIALHPGTTDTGLSEPFQRNVPDDKLFGVERAVSQLLDVINGLENNNHGQFFAWDGQPIPW